MTAYRDQGSAELGLRVLNDAPISEVTVLEDRAAIVRRCRIELKTGSHRLVIAAVSPVLLDKSLVVDVVTGAARVADARVVRRANREDADTPVDVRSLDEAVAEAKRAFEQVSDARKELANEAESLMQTLAMFSFELSEDAAWGRAVNDVQARAIDELIETNRELARELARSAVDEAEARRAFDRSVERRASADRPSASISASLALSIEVDQPGLVELAVRYVVGNACWRPRHRLTLDPDGAKASIEARATVWQNTGEPWNQVRMTFSTERPSLGARPPELETDWLAVTRKGALVIETRDEQVEHATAGDAPKRIVSELPGIDDGGAPQRLLAERPMTVASDGRPHSTTLFVCESPAKRELSAMPELCLAAIVRVVLVNGAAHPLLAGPAELVRGGGAAGRTKLDFVAPGEAFTVGFGPDPDVVVVREIEAIKDQSSLLGSWTTKTHDVRIKLSNLGDVAKPLVVEERVLVSEIEKVQVQVVGEKTTAGAKPDKNGFLRWEVVLPPRGQQTVTLRVVSKRHSDVIG